MRRLAQMTPFEATRIEEQRRARAEPVAIAQLFAMQNERDGMQLLKGADGRYMIVASNAAHLLQPRIMMTMWSPADLARLRDALTRELSAYPSRQ